MLLEKLLRLGAGRTRVEGVQKLGRYELLHPLGAGGMAEVFKARAFGPAGFARDVVIKRILPAYGSDPDFVRMFVDEARILGLVRHPNVVQVYDFGEDNGTLYLALEYVEGPSLSRILRTLRAANRPPPPAFVAYVGREICRALAYVHALEDGDGAPLEVVHRDVTPSNIIVTPAGAVKLLDFGVAKFSTAARSTRAGTVKGKPAYLAPEQLEGKIIDGRVDLFSLGIVMHETLSLQHLFAGDSDFHTAKKIMEMKIPSLTAKRSDLPLELEDIVMRALERDREDRFRSAEEMGHALDEFIVGAKLRLEDVAAFVREIETMAALPAHARTVRLAPRKLTGDTKRLRAINDGVEEQSTDPDLGLRFRMWRARRRAPRLATVVGVGLAMLGAGTAFGLHHSGAAAGRAVAAPAATVARVAR